jgi:hypothetical protein
MKNRTIRALLTAIGAAYLPLAGCQSRPPAPIAPKPLAINVAQPPLKASVFNSPAGTSEVNISMGPKGLSSIKYDGHEFIWSNPTDNTHGEFNGNVFHVQQVILQRGAAHEQTLKDPEPSQVQVDSSSDTISETFGWGTVQGAFATQGSALNITLRVINTSPGQTINAITIVPTWLQFPSKPKEYDGNTPMMAANYGTPSVINTDFGSGDAVLCNLDVTRTLMIGYPYAQNKPQSTIYPLVVASRSHNWSPRQLWPYLNRPIAPGESDSYTLSLRFGPAGSEPKDFASDVYSRFRTQYPYQLNWSDRRPIGYMVLSSTVPHPANGKNPRGWFGNDPTVDVTTTAGRTSLKMRILSEADDAIKRLKQMNAQGVITWDIEGQEFPHATSYVGDPTQINARASEMDPISDAYFKKFRDAGLQVGICIRPEKLIVDKNGAHQEEVPDPAATLINKIAYAKKRWGCTLFYVDSNGDPNAPFDVNIFKKVAQTYPEVLLMPEHQNTLYYAYTAPYDELIANHIARTPDAVKLVYPQAFGVISMATDNQGGPIVDRRAEIVQGVKNGDILLFRAWYAAPEVAQVKSIYDEAKAGK